MNVKPLTPFLGVVISGIDLAKPISQENHETIMKLFREKHLLVFKDKILTPDQQVEFSNLFGTLETFPYNPTQIKNRPEVFRLSNIEGQGYENVGYYWHQDGSFREVPTATSIFHMIEVPEHTGSTLFTSMINAYQSLSDDLKTEIDTLRTVHKNGIIHPLVIDHPYTGEKALYLNVGLTAGVLGMNVSEGTALLKSLNEHLNRKECIYTHYWERGDLVVADNYAVAHQATYADPRYPRTLHRTTVKGETAF